MQKIKEIIKMFTSKEGSLFRYSLGFCLVISLLPTLVVILYLYKETIASPESMITFLYAFIPQDLLEPFVEFVLAKDYSNIISLIITMIVSSFIASRIFYSFMLKSSVDEEFHVASIVVRAKAYVCFLLFLFAIVFITIVNQFIMIPSGIIFLVGLFLSCYYVYRFISFEKKPLSYGVAGASFTSVSIIIIAVVFLYFVKQYTNYNNIYGPLVSLFVLFIVVYLIANIFYLGYCVNVVLEDRTISCDFKHEKFYRSITKRIDDFYNRFRF